MFIETKQLHEDEETFSVCFYIKILFPENPSIVNAYILIMTSKKYATDWQMMAWVCSVVCKGSCTGSTVTCLHHYHHFKRHWQQCISFQSVLMQMSMEMMNVEEEWKINTTVNEGIIVQQPDTSISHSCPFTECTVHSSISNWHETS